MRVACVAGVKRGRERGNLGAQEHAGSYFGREKRRDESFQAQAEEPLRKGNRLIIYGKSQVS